MENLPRDLEFLAVLRRNKIDVNSFPVEIILNAFCAFVEVQTDKPGHALAILEKYRANRR
jgi:hypothetical protein